MIELDGRTRAGGPGADRRLRGLERRRRRRDRGGRAPRGGLGRRSRWRELDPEDYYDFQVNRPHVALDDDGTRRITWPTTRVSVRRGCPACERDVVLVRGDRAEHALAGVLRRAARRRRRARRRDGRHARRAAGGHPAHPAGAGHRHGLRPGAGAVAATWSRPGTRGRPASSACSRTPAARSASRRCRSGPRCRTTSRSRRARRPPWRCCAASRTCSTSPIPLGDLPEEARAWERGVDELAAEDEEIADYVRVARGGTDTAELPEASGEAIAAGVRALPAPPRRRPGHAARR